MTDSSRDERMLGSDNVHALKSILCSRPSVLDAYISVTGALTIPGTDPPVREEPPPTHWTTEADWLHAFARCLDFPRVHRREGLAFRCPAMDRLVSRLAEGHPPTPAFCTTPPAPAPASQAAPSPPRAHGDGPACGVAERRFPHAGATPLHLALVTGETTLALAMVGAGDGGGGLRADASARDAAGWTPLHVAAAVAGTAAASPAAETAVAHALVSAGADVDAVSAAGWTPLHVAALAGAASFVAACVALGADVDAQIEALDGGRARPAAEGWTALMVAARCGHADVVHELCGGPRPALLFLRADSGHAAHDVASAAAVLPLAAAAVSADAVAVVPSGSVAAAAMGRERLRRRRDARQVRRRRRRAHRAAVEAAEVAWAEAEEEAKAEAEAEAEARAETEGRATGGLNSEGGDAMCRSKEEGLAEGSAVLSKDGTGVVTAPPGESPPLQRPAALPAKHTHVDAAPTAATIAGGPWSPVLESAADDIDPDARAPAPLALGVPVAGAGGGAGVKPRRRSLGGRLSRLVSRARDRVRRGARRKKRTPRADSPSHASRSRRSSSPASSSSSAASSSASSSPPASPSPPTRSRRASAARASPRGPSRTPPSTDACTEAPSAAVAASSADPEENPGSSPDPDVEGAPNNPADRHRGRSPPPLSAPAPSSPRQPTTTPPRPPAPAPPAAVPEPFLALLSLIWRGRADGAGGDSAAFLTAALDALALPPPARRAVARQRCSAARGLTLLLAAAARADETAIRAAAAVGCSPAAVDARGRGPLHLLLAVAPAAGPRATAGCIGALLDAGADAGARDTVGRTAVHAAVRAGLPAATVALLAAAGHPPVTLGPDAAGRTPLHEACAGGHAATARVLLRAGADLARPDASGHTPLHDAVRCGHSRLIGTLLNFGAPTNCSTARGDTPFCVALRSARDHSAARGKAARRLALLLADNGMWDDSPRAATLLARSGLQEHLLSGRRRFAELVEEGRAQGRVVLTPWAEGVRFAVPDPAAPRCQDCLATFGFFLRRHHCRICGHAFCGSCAHTFSHDASTAAERQALVARQVLPALCVYAPPFKLCGDCGAFVSASGAARKV